MSEALAHFTGDWHALLVLLLAGFLPNEIWRMFGLWFGGGIDEGERAMQVAVVIARCFSNEERSGHSAVRCGA